MLATDGGARGAIEPARIRREVDVAEKAATRIAPHLPGGRVYTEGVAPVERPIDASIAQFAAEGVRSRARCGRKPTKSVDVVIERMAHRRPPAS